MKDITDIANEIIEYTNSRVKPGKFEQISEDDIIRTLVEITEILGVTDAFRYEDDDGDNHQLGICLNCKHAEEICRKKHRSGLLTWETPVLRCTIENTGTDRYSSCSNFVERK